MDLTSKASNDSDIADLVAHSQSLPCPLPKTEQSQDQRPKYRLIICHKYYSNNRRVHPVSLGDGTEAK